jgi:hypothetical protein
MIKDDNRAEFLVRKRSAYDNLHTTSVRRGIERWMGCVHFVRPTAGRIGRRSTSVVHGSYNNRRTHSRTLFSKQGMATCHVDNKR